MSKSIAKLKKLLTSTKLPSAFTKTIKDADIFWEKPLGTIKDFDRAFRSSKTDPALRYVMGLAGILGEPEIIDRSLRNLRKQLTFKVSPKYRTKKGRITLSHFEIKGYNRAGSGEYLRINSVAKKMMMGTPVDARYAKVASEAIKPEPSSAELVRRQHWERVTGYKWGSKYGRIDNKYLINQHWKRVTGYAKGSKHGQILSDKKQKELDTWKRLTGYVKGSKYGQIRAVDPREVMRKKEKTFERATEKIFQSIKKEGANIALKRVDKVIPTNQTVKRWENWLDQRRIADTKALHKHLAQMDAKTAVEDKKKARQSKMMPDAYKLLKRLRNLTPSERARIMRAIWQLQRHYQGLLWVLHSTIKLNDKRRQFWYIDDNFVPTYEEGWETINLHGFPKHIEHYIKESSEFADWIDWLGLRWGEERLRTEMFACLNFANDIEGRTFDTPDEAQDQLDELLKLCTSALHLATAQSTALMNTINIFYKKIDPKTNPVPRAVPLHKRHPTIHKVQHYAKTESGLRSKIDRYIKIYGDIRIKKHIKEGKPHQLGNLTGAAAAISHNLKELKKPRPIIALRRSLVKKE